MSMESNAKQSTQSQQLTFDIKADHRPTDYEYAVLSQHVYRGSQLKPNQTIPQLRNWKVESIQSGEANYFGAIYFNSTKRQVVLAHRGTDSLPALFEDFMGICLNVLSPQKKEIFAFIQHAIEFSEKMDFHLSFTGHSLGAFLAELSVYYCHR